MSNARQPSTPESGDSHTVLLVEDQPAIRRYAVRVLERAGCRVLPAADGREALTILDRYPDTIELLVTDIALPDQSGYELARAVRERRHEMRILYATGSPPLSADDPAGVGPAAPTLSKPYDSAALVRAVTSALNDD
jgi:CheY-like chemotaxis protein